MRNVTRRCAFSGIAIAFSVFAGAASADDFPSRPITLMVGACPRGHYRHHRTALRRSGVQDHRAACHRRKPDWRGRRTCGRGSAERAAGWLHAAGVLRLTACNGAGGRQCVLRAGQGLCADHLPVQQRRGTARARRQSGQDRSPNCTTSAARKPAASPSARRGSARRRISWARKSCWPTRCRPRRCTTAAVRR